MGVNSTKEFLQKRVEYLEEVNRKITSSLDIVKNLANFQNQIGNRYDLQTIFSESTEKILELIDFKAISFLLYDIQNYEFTIEHVYPQFLKGDFLVEVDNQIESGSFAWTLSQKRPVFVKPIQLDESHELLLHVLSTDKMVLGIFFGQLHIPKEEVFPESLELLTIALNTTSFAIENFKLYSEVDEYNEKLEKKVKEKTADILEINEKLKYEIEVRKTAERDLKTHKVYFESLFESSPVAVVSLDNSSNIMIANPQFLTLFGYESDEIIGRNINDLIVPEDKKGEQLWNGPSEDKISSIETVRRKKDGTTINVTISWSPLVIGKTQVGTLAIYKDITERKIYEKGLETAKLLAEEATKAKTEFLTNMSHEIRTPLNAILGMCELVMETELNREQREYVEVVRASSEGLFSLVNDILDFSMLESGMTELDISEFNLGELLEGIADIFSLQCDKKGIELLYHIPMGTPLLVKGDVTRIRQILINLVANAVKFTEKGHVCLKVENGPIRKDSVSRFRFIVEDSGIGIEEAHQQKIFEKFSQADNSSSRKFSGTGLGLNIVKSLTEIMKGKLTLNSKPGKGCTFTAHLDLPVIDSSKKAVWLTESEAVTLIVDAYDKSRKALCSLLKSNNVKVIECTGRQTPVKLIQNNQQIACVIVNCANSMNWVKQIRKDEKLNYLKMILLVSKSNLNNWSKIKDEVWLTKPLKERQLLAAIDLIYKDIKAYKDALGLPDESESPANVAKKVLIVEDNLQNQKIIKKMLKLSGYQVITAENGKQAVDIVDAESFDAILMDIQMPVMDGFEATEQIRKNEKSGNKKKVPIIALTAHAISDYKNKCLTSGMDDYLTKPVKKQILLDKIESWSDRITIVE